MADGAAPVRDDAVCVLTSGGLDSGVLIAELAKQYRQVQPVYVRCGLDREQAERYWLRRFLKKLRACLEQHPTFEMLSMDQREVYGDHWSLTGKNVPDYHSDDFEVYLPGRNIVLLAKTAGVLCVAEHLHDRHGAPQRESFPRWHAAVLRTFPGCALRRYGHAIAR